MVGRTRMRSLYRRESLIARPPDRLPPAGSASTVLRGRACGGPAGRPSRASAAASCERAVARRSARRILQRSSGSAGGVRQVTRMTASARRRSPRSACAADASTRKWPDAGTMTFVAPSSALPPGMCGSNRPKTDTMRPLTDSSRPSITIVSSSGRKARMLGTKNRPASGDPWKGVHTATSPSTPSGARESAPASGGAVASAAASAGSPPAAASLAAAMAAPDETSRCLPISPPLLCATSTRPAPAGALAASERASRCEVSTMPRLFIPSPWTTFTR